MTNLEEKLAAICESVPFDVRYCIKDATTGVIYERAADTETPSASTRKVSIMMAALKAVHDGRLELDESILYEHRLRDGVASGILRYFTPGLRITLRDAIAGMIVLSDNVCTRMVLERLKLDDVQSYCEGIGMTGTHHRFLIPPPALSPNHDLKEVTTTTARDQTMLLEALLAAQVSEAAAARLGSTTDHCRFALATLSRQILRYGIPSRLPYETPFACKGGRGKRGRMDVGVVFHGGEPLYVISVFTDGVPAVLPDGTPGYTAALETIGRLSRACWDAMLK